MLVKNETGSYLKLPYIVGDEVYIGTMIDWNLGIVKGIVSDIEAHWSKEINDFYFRIYVEHEYIYSKKNPNRIVNRYIFFEGELAKTYDEAKQKLLDRENQKKNHKCVNEF